MNCYAAERADAIYRTGPETFLSSVTLVVAGTVDGLTREIVAKTEGVPTPVSWIAKGRLVDLRAIKGRLQIAKVDIARKEQAMFAIGRLDEPGWTREYGDLVNGGAAVAFFDIAGSGKITSLVVPSGRGEQNLYHLLEQAARIESHPDKHARIAAEAHWLTHAATEAEKKAALRMLLHHRAPWDTVSAAIQEDWTSLSPQLRQYFTGAVGFGVTEGIWPAADDRPVVFMCNAFMAADDRSSSSIMLQLKQLLTWSERKDASAAMDHIGKLVTECYRRRLADRPLSAELKAYFDRLDPKYGLR